MLGKIKETVRRLSGKMDRYQKAVTFAEAGEQASAQEALQTEPVKEEPRRLVVIGRESVFSQEIIDYALEMAERMSYEIIALNAAPLSCETFKLFSSSRNKICQDFTELSQKNVRLFQESAEKGGIPFTHVVKFSTTHEILIELKKEIGEFDFVVSEMEEQENVSRAENGESVKQEIFVYTMM